MYYILLLCVCTPFDVFFFFFHLRNVIVIYILLIGPIIYVIAGFRFFSSPPSPDRALSDGFIFYFILIVRRTTPIYNNIPV